MHLLAHCGLRAKPKAVSTSPLVLLLDLRLPAAGLHSTCVRSWGPSGVPCASDLPPGPRPAFFWSMCPRRRGDADVQVSSRALSLLLPPQAVLGAFLLPACPAPALGPSRLRRGCLAFPDLFPDTPGGSHLPILPPSSQTPAQTVPRPAASRSGCGRELHTQAQPRTRSIPRFFMQPFIRALVFTHSFISPTDSHSAAPRYQARG